MLQSNKIFVPGGTKRPADIGEAVIKYAKDSKGGFSYHCELWISRVLAIYREFWSLRVWKIFRGILLSELCTSLVDDVKEALRDVWTSEVAHVISGQAAQPSTLRSDDSSHSSMLPCSIAYKVHSLRKATLIQVL